MTQFDRATTKVSITSPGIRGLTYGLCKPLCLSQILVMTLIWSMVSIHSVMAQEGAGAAAQDIELWSPLPSQPRSALLDAPPRFQEMLPTVESLQADWDVTGDVQWETAITLAELSVLAYTDEHNRRMALRLIGFNDVVTLDDGPMSGFVASTDDVVVVAFRGTNMFSPRDWLANIDFFWQENLGQGRKVHKGFYRGYRRFADTIKRELRGRNPSYIWLTGHSLGGAMATCCAYDWVISRMPLTGVITFGQPRVCNPATASFLDQQLRTRYLRFRNAEDIVPTVPPAGPSWLSDYKHAGQQAWLKQGTVDRTVTADTFVGNQIPEDTNDGQMADRARADISAEELVELQRILQTSQSYQENAAIPEFLISERRARPDFRFGLHDGPIQRLPMFTTDQLVSAEARIAKFDDHSMIEYLRFLNEQFQSSR